MSEQTGKAELWATVDKAPTYEVSSEGRVRRGDRILRLQTKRTGYVAVALSVGAGRYWYPSVHVLVAEAFLGQRPSLRHQVAHSNGDRESNAAENLRWATPKENASDRSLHGNWFPARGSRHHQAILNEEDAREIKIALAGGERPSTLADRYGVARPTISDIRKGRTWKHVAA